MTDNNLKNLPLGTSDFAALRLANEIYVDKTDLVYELASKRHKFFGSSRRFGKSLLISTFESLFRHGLRDFKGLAIEKLWIEESKPLVVRLDFSEIKNFPRLKTSRENLLLLFLDVSAWSDSNMLTTTLTALQVIINMASNIRHQRVSSPD